MKIKNVLPLIFITIAFNCYCQQKNFSSKIYIFEDRYLVPFTEDSLKAMFYYEHISKKINGQKKYILPLEIGSFFDRKIKYSIVPHKQLIALSVADSSSVRRRVTSTFGVGPTPICVRIEEITESDYQISLKPFLKKSSATRSTFDLICDFDLSPLEEYYPYYKYDKYYPASWSGIHHDFSANETKTLFINSIDGKIKVWEYNTEGKIINVNDFFNATLLNEYEWELNENFYTTILGKQLLLFTESGYIFCLGKTAEKVGKLPDNLIDSAIVVDKDHDRLYLLKKSHIEEGLAFAEILKKYAQEIKLPGK